MLRSLGKGVTDALKEGFDVARHGDGDGARRVIVPFCGNTTEKRGFPVDFDFVRFAKEGQEIFGSQQVHIFD